MVSINYYRKGGCHRGRVVAPLGEKIEKKMKKMQNKLKIVRRNKLIGVRMKRIEWERWGIKKSATPAAVIKNGICLFG